MFREMTDGVLQWSNTGKDSEAAAMVEMLSPALRGLQPDASITEYEMAMKPIYNQVEISLQYRNGVRAVQLHDPVLQNEEFRYKTAADSNNNNRTSFMRFTTPQRCNTSNKSIWIWQTIINRESERLLNYVNELNATQQDNDIFLVEVRNLQDIISQLIGQLGFRSDDQISQFLLYELSAIYKELDYLLEERISPQENAQPISFTKRHQVIHSGHWWKTKAEALLDKWIAKYYHTAPVAGICHLLTQIHKQELHAIDKKLNMDLSDIRIWKRHLQLILLLIITKNIGTEAQKMQLYDYNKSESLYNNIVENLSNYSLKQLGKLLEESHLLDEANITHKIDRFDLIKDYLEKLHRVIRQAFSKPPSLSATQSPSGDRLPTFMERLEHEFITLKDLAKNTQLSEDALRKQLKRLNIDIIKRGEIVYISYQDYTQQ